MKLLFEHWRNYITETFLGTDLTKRKSIEYTAFILDEESHKRLSRLAPEQWKVYAHHMTIIPPKEQTRRLPTQQFFDGCLTVTGIAKNDQVMAARVNYSLYNKLLGLPHVTIATNPSNGARPELSNNFVEEDYVPIKPFQICGTVKEVYAKPI